MDLMNIKLWIQKIYSSMKQKLWEIKKYSNKFEYKSSTGCHFCQENIRPECRSVDEHLEL